MRCVKCGNEIHDENQPCKICGNHVLQCSKCGSSITPDLMYCPQCGSRCRRIGTFGICMLHIPFMVLEILCAVAACIMYGNFESPFSAIGLSILNGMLFLLPVCYLGASTIINGLEIHYTGRKGIDLKLRGWGANVFMAGFLVIGYFFIGSEFNKCSTWLYGRQCREVSKFMQSSGDESLQYIAPELVERYKACRKQMFDRYPDYPRDYFNSSMIHIFRVETDGKSKVFLFGAGSNPSFTLQKIRGIWFITEIPGMDLNAVSQEQKSVINPPSGSHSSVHYRRRSRLTGR